MVRVIGLLKLDSYFFQMVFDIWIEQCVHNSLAFLSALLQRLKTSTFTPGSRTSGFVKALFI